MLVPRAPVVASGGVSTIDDLVAIAGLVPVGVEGAIIGTALYTGAFTLEDALSAVAEGATMTVAVRVIPCLDVDDGRVVKGVNFEGLRDVGDPVDLAQRYDREGADELTFLDITASKDRRDTVLDVVRRTAEQVFIPLTVGGGVRNVEDVDTLLRAGADKAAINTGAIERPEVIQEIANRFGRQVLVLSVDARRALGDRRPASRSRPTAAARALAWTRSSGPSEAPSSAPARSFSTRWMPTAPRRVRPRADRGGPRRGLGAGDRQRWSW